MWKSCLSSECSCKKPPSLPEMSFSTCNSRNFGVIDVFWEYVKMYFPEYFSMTAPKKNSHQTNIHVQTQLHRCPSGILTLSKF